MSNEALIMARLQLRYWQEQCEAAQKAGDAELLAQSKLYLQDTQAELAALEPPADGETSDNRSIDLFDEAEVRAYCVELRSHRGRSERVRQRGRGSRRRREAASA